MIKITDNGFIGGIGNQTIHFTGSDTEERFNKNLNTQPNDWYYRDKIIEYNYNSLGHRCKNIEDVDLSNYILFSGCSHTEGTGLELQHTYPYRLAEMMGCDYYNLGLGGTGVDIMTHNITMWSNRITHPPRAVVILWPDSTRFMTFEDKKSIVTHMISLKNPKSINLIIAGDDIGFFESRKQLSKILISNLYNSRPVIHACSCTTPEDNLPMLTRLDFARDETHYGILSHDEFARELLSILIR